MTRSLLQIYCWWQLLYDTALMTDPRVSHERLSLALRHAGARGVTDKHKLMIRTAEALDEVQRMLVAIDRDLARGHHDSAKLWLTGISQILGCESTDTKDVHTDKHQHNQKQNTSTVGN
jgi:hypothetical protein